MNWAENHIKLAHCRSALKRKQIPETEDNLMKEYILAGGRVVHPETGEIVDNNTGAEHDERGQVTERHPEAYEKRVPELIAAFKGDKVKKVVKK